jgi:hypothetical protein
MWRWVKYIVWTGFHPLASFPARYLLRKATFFNNPSIKKRQGYVVRQVKTMCDKAVSIVGASVAEPTLFVSAPAPTFQKIWLRLRLRLHLCN